MNNTLELHLEKSAAKLDEALVEKGYTYVGEFLYDYPPLPHKWSERIRTEMYEKDGQLWYFMGISEWDGERIKSVRIGKIEKQEGNNPECKLTS